MGQSEEEKICEFYRGESKSYDTPCQPSILRYIDVKDILSVEAKYYNLTFDYMKDIGFYSQTDEGLNGAFDLKYLSLLQHYGFGTRLLDISKNKAVALYFACNENFKERGYIYTFDNKKYKYLKDVNGKTITRKMESLEKFNKESSNNFNEMFDESSRKFTVEVNAIVDCDKVFNELNNIRYKAQVGSFILAGNEIENNCLTGRLTEVKVSKNEIIEIDSNKKLLYLYKLCCEKGKIDEFDIENDKCICYVEMFPDDEFSFKIVSFWGRFLFVPNEVSKKNIFNELIGYLNNKFFKKDYCLNIDINSELAKDILEGEEKFYFFCYEFSKYFSENIEKFKEKTISNYKLKKLVTNKGL